MLVDKAFTILTQYNRKWRIDGRLAEPGFDDVVRLIDSMKQTLTDVDDSASVQCGGLMLVKDGNSIDLYVHLGDLHDEDSGS